MVMGRNKQHIINKQINNSPVTWFVGVNIPKKQDATTLRTETRHRSAASSFYSLRRQQMWGRANKR